MYFPSDYKLKYKHVAFKNWPPKLCHVAFNTWWLPTYLVRWLTLNIILGVTIKQNHPLWFKKVVWKNFNHARKHFKQKSFKLPLFPITWPLWWISNGICPLKKIKIISGLRHVNTTQSWIGWLVGMVCPCIF